MDYPFKLTHVGGASSVTGSCHLMELDNGINIMVDCDLLVLESTYGNIIHEDRSKRIERLSIILKRALNDNGKVFIPAFALGRTQELIYEFDRIIAEYKIDKTVLKLTGYSAQADQNGLVDFVKLMPAKPKRLNWFMVH